MIYTVYETLYSMTDQLCAYANEKLSCRKLVYIIHQKTYR